MCILVAKIYFMIKVNTHFTVNKPQTYIIYFWSPCMLWSPCHNPINLLKWQFRHKGEGLRKVTVCNFWDTIWSQNWSHLLSQHGGVPWMHVFPTFWYFLPSIMRTVNIKNWQFVRQTSILISFNHLGAKMPWISKRIIIKD